MKESEAIAKVERGIPCGLVNALSRQEKVALAREFGEVEPDEPELPPVVQLSRHPQIDYGNRIGYCVALPLAAPHTGEKALDPPGRGTGLLLFIVTNGGQASPGANALAEALIADYNRARAEERERETRRDGLAVALEVALNGWMQAGAKAEPGSPFRLCEAELHYYKNCRGGWPPPPRNSPGDRSGETTKGPPSGPPLCPGSNAAILYGARFICGWCGLRGDVVDGKAPPHRKMPKVSGAPAVLGMPPRCEDHPSTGLPDTLVATQGGAHRGGYCESFEGGVSITVSSDPHRGDGFNHRTLAQLVEAWNGRARWLTGDPRVSDYYLARMAHRFNGSQQAVLYWNASVGLWTTFTGGEPKAAITGWQPLPAP